MQKAPGINLTTKWWDLSTKQIKRAALGVVEIEKKLFNLPFAATGSIYFKKDLSLELQTPLYSHGNDTEESKKFCIGPIADYMFWYGKRANLDLDRGPWKDPVKYLRSTAEKEIKWTNSFGEDREPDFSYNTIGMGRQSTKSYIALLEEYQKLTAHLLPENHADSLAQPTLRHPDLTPGNIFVTPEKAAGYPRAFENPESEVPSELIEPSLPENLEMLSPEMRAQAQEPYRRIAMFYYYRVFNGAYNQAHLAAISDPFLQLRQHLVDRASRQWNGNLITLKGAIIRTAQFWELLPGAKGVVCPVQYEEADVNNFLEKEAKWLEMSFAEETWRDSVCHMNEDGWVRNEDYSEAVTELKRVTDIIWSQCEGDEEDEAWFKTGWTLKDHDEVD